MVDAPDSSKIFHSIEQRVRDTTTQPERGVEMTDANYRAGKTYARLNGDPGLLRIGGRRATSARRSEPAIERPLSLRRLPVEVRRKTHAQARMPQVLRDKAMAATRALPERWFGHSVLDLGRL